MDLKAPLYLNLYKELTYKNRKSIEIVTYFENMNMCIKGRGNRRKKGTEGRKEGQRIYFIKIIY